MEIILYPVCTSNALHKNISGMYCMFEHSCGLMLFDLFSLKALVKNLIASKN